MSIGTNIKITLTDRTYLTEETLITAPVNVYAALATFLNKVDGKNWNIILLPTDVEYFTGEEQ
jgi:hypothetical protein